MRGENGVPPPPLVPMLPESFDGFRLELDPERQRADVILDRPPLNIVTMTEREQLRAVLEQLTPMPASASSCCGPPSSADATSARPSGCCA
jgi:hypothetical protein